MNLEDAVTCTRGKLIPPGYTTYPFRKNTDESLLNKLRSIVETFRSHVKDPQQGVDFTKHLYIPEWILQLNKYDMTVRIIITC